MNIFSGKDKAKEKKIEEILLQNYDSYYRLAYSYVQNEADAGDIVQNGAYRAIRGSHTLEKTEYAATWVYRIMLNEIFRFCKVRNKNLVSLEEMPIEEGKEDVYKDVDLHRAINMLSPEDKAVVQLRFFEDKKLEDNAKILGQNDSTEKSRQNRSMKKLRLDLEES